MRALAVLIVVVFHAWPAIFSGGFIGVDIFFVISGYLITSIITKSINTNSFSYADFYSRRVKRIFPSLLICLVFVLAVACTKLYKLDYRLLIMTAKTMAASAVFGANI
jgi:peptidoglycan/LPS O-acetylase OafA/YrhL